MPACVMPVCVLPLCVMPVCMMPFRVLPSGIFAFLLNGHLQNRLVAMLLWIDAFLISMILFQLLSIEFCHRCTSIYITGNLYLVSSAYLYIECF